MQVPSLGWEDPLEKEMATHSSTLAWRIPWMENPGAGYNPWGHQESDTTERLTLTNAYNDDSSKHHLSDIILLCSFLHLFFQFTKLEL